MHVVDCFIFYNELKMLEFRLTELDDVVDFFVIVEATKTFKGDDKELFLKNNWQKFTKWHPKIIHVIVNDMPIDCNGWARESFQRNCIDRGLKLIPNLQSSDLILVHDLDEIPDKNVILRFRNSGLKGIITLLLRVYYYNFETQCVGNHHIGRICDYETFRGIGCAQKVRENFTGPEMRGGWHLSYFGDTTFIKNKIQQFSHQELNLPKFTDMDAILEKINKCQDLFERKDHTFTHVEISQNDYLPCNYKMLL